MDIRRLSIPNKIRWGFHNQRDTELDISTSKGDQRLQCKKKHGSDLYYKHHAVLNCREDCKALHYNFKLTSSPVLHTSGCMKGASCVRHISHVMSDRVWISEIIKTSDLRCRKIIARLWQYTLFHSCIAVSKY